MKSFRKFEFVWKTVHISKWKFRDVTNYTLKMNLAPRFRGSRIRS
jgi:hypothetical protein